MNEKLRTNRSELALGRTSPVIAMSLGTQAPVSSDTKAQIIAMPALGPSFFCAPAGK